MFSKSPSFIVFSGLGIAYLIGSIPRIDLSYQTYLCVCLFIKLSEGLSHKKQNECQVCYLILVKLLLKRFIN